MTPVALHTSMPPHQNLYSRQRRLRKALRYFLRTPFLRNTFSALAALLTFVAILALLHFFRVTSLHDGKPTWTIGTSKIDITPTERVWLSGFASRNRTADSVRPLSRLYVRAITIRSASAPRVPYVIVSADVVGLDRKLSDRIYAAALRDYGLPRERLRICVTHTHSGPVVGDNLAPLVPNDPVEKQKIVRYTSTFFYSIMSAIRESLDEKVQANGHFERGTAQLAVNRREITENDFDGVNRGTTEDGVPVIWFTNRESVIAGLFGYAAHATVLTNNYRFSGDFVGLTTLQLESEGGIWLFLAGCGGDQNVYPRGTNELAVRHAKTLRTAVANAKKRSTANQLGQNISAQHSFVRLRFQKQYRAEELNYYARSKDTVKRRAAHLLLEKLGSDGRTVPDYRYGISVWHIGDTTIAFLGGEPTVGYCDSLRKVGIAWVVGYCEDVMGYIGTRAVVDDGGREGGERAAWYYGLPSAWNGSVEEVIVGSVRTMLGHE